jgi:polysaccharide biosynthesis protein PslH
LQIVPLRIGGGTRLKIVESLAIRTPVVSTTIGAQGLDLAHGEDVLLADDADEFVRQTVRALQNEKLRHHLETRGLQTARERFSWKMIGAQLARVYAKLQSENLATQPRFTHHPVHGFRAQDSH